MKTTLTCACGEVCVVPEQEDPSAAHCPTCGRALSVAPVAEAESSFRPEVREIEPSGLNEPIEVVPALSKREQLAREWKEFSAQTRRLTPRVVFSPSLIGLNVLFFVIMLIHGVPLFSPSAAVLLQWGADYGPRTVHGEWWRILTCVFVHAGLIHLVFNMWCLAAMGPFVERLVGNVGFLVLYLLSGLGGSLASLAWSPTVVSVGASGAIFGVYAALVGIYLRAGHTIPTQVLKQHRSSTVAFLAYNLLGGMFVPGIDMAAHVGGLVVGFLCGLVLGHPINVTALPGRSWRNAVVALAGSVLIALAAVQVQKHVADVPDIIGESNELARIEKKVLGVYNDAADRSRRQLIDDDEFVRVVEQEVLPPWRSARARLNELKKELPLNFNVEQVSWSMQYREEAWELLCEAIRRHDKQLAKQSEQKMREAEQILQRLDAQAKTRKR
jgi:rhomboid protease GluP